MRYTSYTTPQLQLHYITTTAALCHTQSSSCGWGGHCNHSNKHKSNHLSVDQWIPSAIRDSQHPTSLIGFLFWNFRHLLVRYYWYKHFLFIFPFWWLGSLVKIAPRLAGLHWSGRHRWSQWSCLEWNEWNTVIIMKYPILSNSISQINSPIICWSSFTQQ